MAISGGDGSIILTTKIDESGLSDGLKSLRKDVLNFEKALKGVAVAGAGAFVAVGTAAIKTYADFEQLSGGVQKIFDEIDYATIERDAQEAFKTMQMSANQYLGVMTTVGANFASTLGDAKGYEVAKQGMKAITDFATGTGRSVDELSQKYQMITRSTSVYQSIADQFAGILPATSAGFLEQAQAAGFLSDSYTKLTEVPMAEYQEAVTQMLTKGVDALGLTNNAANEASTTLSGSFSMLQGSWNNLLVAFANPEQDLNLAIDDFKDSLSAVADNLLPRIGEVFGSIFGSIPTPILAVASAIGAVVAGITAYNAVMEVKNVLDAIQEAGSIKLALAQIGLNTAMLASPITWVVAGITALVAAFVLLWNKCEGFRNFWIGLWELLKGTLTAIWEEHIKPLWEEHLQPAIQAIMDKLTELWEVVIKPVIDKIVAILKDLWDNVLKPIVDWLVSFFVERFKFAFDTIKSVIQATKEIIATVIDSIKNIFIGIIDFIIGVFTGDWEKAWNGVKKVFTGIINGIIGVFESMVNFVIRGINKLISGLDELVNEAGSVIGLDIHIPTIPEIKIPRLAKGAVIPPNSEFMAILGDQKRGVNIETPLQTMIDAFNTALDNRNTGGVIKEEHYNLNETELMTIIYKLVKGGERIKGSSLISGGAY